MNVATRNRRQRNLVVTHEWWPSGPLFKELHIGAQHRQDWRCKNCFATCVQHYVSHRHGWQKPMKWFSACKPVAELYDLFHPREVT